MNIAIQHDTDEQRFFAEVDGQEIDAEMTYSRPKEDTLNFNHTFVDEEFRNLKIGEKLATTALGYAREKGYKVMATCQFMSTFLRRHPEYQDLM